MKKSFDDYVKESVGKSGNPKTSAYVLSNYMNYKIKLLLINILWTVTWFVFISFLCIFFNDFTFLWLLILWILGVAL